MAGLIGSFVGGIIAMMFFTYILDGVLYKNQEPDRRAFSLVVTVYLTVSTIAMFGMADGGPLALHAYLLYLPGALLAWVFARRKYRKLWNQSDVDPDVFT